MSQESELLEKIRNNPKDVHLAELVKLMEYHGFKKRRTKDAYYFYHEKLSNEPVIPRAAIPHGRRENKVKHFYIKICLDAIEKLLTLKLDEKHLENID